MVVTEMTAITNTGKNLHVHQGQKGQTMIYFNILFAEKQNILTGTYQLQCSTRGRRSDKESKARLQAQALCSPAR